MPGQSFTVIDRNGEYVGALLYDRSLQDVTDTRCGRS